MIFDILYQSKISKAYQVWNDADQTIVGISSKVIYGLLAGRKFHVNIPDKMQRPQIPLV